MRDIDLKSLGVGLDGIKAALARERRPGVRRRLVAVGKILAGRSINEAARAAKATPGSVDRWLGQVRRSGFQSLLSDGRHGHAKQSMKPNQVNETRRQIATALAGPLKPQVRARLIAIDTALSGRPIDEVAASARVLPNAVKSWLRAVTYHSIAPTLARWEGRGKPRPRLLDADPVALRELAARERNPRIRKRMLAIVCVAEGMSPLDAAVSVGLQHDTVLRSMKRFRGEGVAAFQDRKIAGRPHKLNPAQLEEVGRALPERPKMSCGELRDLLWACFRVRYSLGRLRHLLKEKLGVQWKPARSHAGPVSLEARRTLAGRPKTAQKRRAATDTKNSRGRPRKLNTAQLEELRDYVLKRPETSFWRLHRLVWNCFHVRHSHASLKRLLKSEFGIVWTGSSQKLGEGLNLADLQEALADATDWRMKRRLKALIDLAMGRDADTVARANRVHLETLRNWAKGYRALHQGVT